MHLIDYEKDICLEKLKEAAEHELWDAFLRGQTELFFKNDYFWIEQAQWWKNARSVLDIGSGNGSFLHKLFQQEKTKTYLGLEKHSLFVESAARNYSGRNLTFLERDADIFDSSLVHKADLILFRLTLQHLSNPVIALENAWEYLLPHGHILIIDSYDSATKTSHPIETYSRAISLLIESGHQSGNINRTTTLEIMNEIK